MRGMLCRYNIYSCLTFTLGDLEICFDPAKIRKMDLDKINPDLICISHESMDHMDPTQVYFLQKKKNCKIFCSIAAAVDLIQFFPLDIDFIDSIHVMIPGMRVIVNEIEITAVKSIHCDYMLPVVYRLDFLKNSFSLLHCFDTHLSQEIQELSIGTDLAIIPLGIAKGVSEATGLAFAKAMKSRYFVTNHFKDPVDLKKFHTLIQNNPLKERFFLVDWNEKCQISIPLEKLRRIEIPIQAKGRKELLIENAILALHEWDQIEENFLAEAKKDLLTPSTDENNGLKPVALFFYGLLAQQKGKIFSLNEVIKMIDNPFDHINYWIVEYLGRSAASKGEGFETAIDALLHIAGIPHLYTSVVVRRKLFWEFHRIMKVFPRMSARFFPIFEDGLTDSNSDVRLLALLCFGLANRVYPLSTCQLSAIFARIEDPEDDVRETAVKIIGDLSKKHKDVIVRNLDQISKLLEDKNCHVQFLARETYDLLSL